MKKFLIVLIPVTTLLISGCSSQPRDQKAFSETLMKSQDISQEKADCISGRIFDKYGANQDDINKIATYNYEQLTTKPQAANQDQEVENTYVEGFEQTYTSAIEECG